MKDQCNLVLDLQLSKHEYKCHHTHLSLDMSIKVFHYFVTILYELYKRQERTYTQSVS